MLQSFLQRHQGLHQENKIVMFSMRILQATPGDDIRSRSHATGDSRTALQLYLAHGAAVPGGSDFVFLNQVTELVGKA